jgi:hypothetical protein
LCQKKNSKTLSSLLLPPRKTFAEVRARLLETRPAFLSHLSDRLALLECGRALVLDLCRSESVETGLLFRESFLLRDPGLVQATAAVAASRAAPCEQPPAPQRPSGEVFDELEKNLVAARERVATEERALAAAAADSSANPRMVAGLTASLEKRRQFLVDRGREVASAGPAVRAVQEATAAVRALESATPPDGGLNLAEVREQRYRLARERSERAKVNGDAAENSPAVELIRAILCARLNIGESELSCVRGLSLAGAVGAGSRNSEFDAVFTVKDGKHDAIVGVVEAKANLADLGEARHQMSMATAELGSPNFKEAEYFGRTSKAGEARQRVPLFLRGAGAAAERLGADSVFLALGFRSEWAPGELTHQLREILVRAVKNPDRFKEPEIDDRALVDGLLHLGEKFGKLKKDPIEALDAMGSEQVFEKICFVF